MKSRPVVLSQDTLRSSSHVFGVMAESLSSPSETAPAFRSVFSPSTARKSIVEDRAPKASAVCVCVCVCVCALPRNTPFFQVALWPPSPKAPRLGLGGPFLFLSFLSLSVSLLIVPLFFCLLCFTLLPSFFPSSVYPLFCFSSSASRIAWLLSFSPVGNASNFFPFTSRRRCAAKRPTPFDTIAEKDALSFLAALSVIGSCAG